MICTMDLLDNKGRRLRGNSLPWNAKKSPPRPNGFDILSTSQKLAAQKQLNSEINKKNSKPVVPISGFNDAASSTYMVINFEKDFKKEMDDPEMPANMPRIDKKKTADAIAKYNEKAADKGNRLPMLQSTFALPKKQDETGGRNMFRRSDGSTQTPLDMTKHNFEGLSDYTEWCSKEVEPILKVCHNYFLRNVYS